MKELCRLGHGARMDARCGALMQCLAELRPDAGLLPGRQGEDGGP